MSDHAESSAIAIFSRNDDQMTVALRSGDSMDLDDIVHLNRTATPFHHAPSSFGTLSTTVFSSPKESSGTKPTSAGTSYPVAGYNGKGKAVATYASSLSATHGSASEAEADQDNALVGIGDWAGDDPTTSRPLKGGAKARRRPRMNRRPKQKKPVVIIQQDGPPHVASEDDSPTIKLTSRRDSKETKYVRRRPVKSEHDRLALAEEGRISLVAEPLRTARVPLSRMRLYAVIGLLIATALTFALSTFAAHYTGKNRMACTKGIIFSATVTMSSFTVLAMIVARRALQEALLAGLLEFLVGFALVVEIHEFM